MCNTTVFTKNPKGGDGDTDTPHPHLRDRARRNGFPPSHTRPTSLGRAPPGPSVSPPPRLAAADAGRSGPGPGPGAVRAPPWRTSAPLALEVTATSRRRAGAGAAGGARARARAPNRPLWRAFPRAGGGKRRLRTRTAPTAPADGRRRLPAPAGFVGQSLLRPPAAA